MVKKLSCSKLHNLFQGLLIENKILEVGGDPLTFPQNELQDVTVISEWLGKME